MKYTFQIFGTVTLPAFEHTRECMNDEFAINYARDYAAAFASCPEVRGILLFDEIRLIAEIRNIWTSKTLLALPNEEEEEEEEALGERANFPYSGSC